MFSFIKKEGFYILINLSKAYAVIYKKKQGHSIGSAHLVFQPCIQRERLHLYKLLGDVCVAWTTTICSQAFP